MKKIFFIFSIVFFINSCKSTTTINSIPTRFEVPVTTVNSSIVTTYVEVYVSNEPQDDISIVKNNFFYQLKNLSHTYRMNLTLMICLEGEAVDGSPKIYTSRQSRWDDSSKTITLSDNLTIYTQQVIYKDTTKNNSDEVLLKMLKQDKFYIVVKNEIPASFTSAVYTNTPVPTGTTSTIKITYPENNSVIRDGKIRIRGIFDSSKYTGITIWLGGVSVGTATTSGSGNQWYYDLDTLASLGERVELKATATGLAGSSSDSINITPSPAVNVENFYAELKIESEIFGAMSLFSIF